MLRTRTFRCWPAAWLLGILLLPPASAAGAAPTPPLPWRVCVTDASLPPYLNNNPGQLGIFERLMVDAGRQAGLNVQLLRYPINRCVSLLVNGGIEAAISAPQPTSMAFSLFPMKDGAVDPARRLGRLNMVWVKRPDSAFHWEGRAASAAASQPRQPLIVGTRMAMGSVAAPLRALGFEVDANALNARQLLKKLAARRVDLAVALQEEVEFALAEPALGSLVMLPRPFLSNDYYAVVRPKPAPELKERIDAWWTAIGRLRELPAYRSRPEP